jgi:CheY-like chemotaxis protein
VVVNLLTNAAKYTEEGGSVWLTVEQTGQLIELQVRDSGIGISADLLPNVFDLFTQADRSLDRSKGGLGIGLALVKQLVDLHGRSVQASSVLGQGSQFVVRVPVNSSSLTPSSSPPAKAPSPATKAYRVLVVDDNVDAAQTLRMLLERSAHEVRVASDGSTVLETTLDFRPHLVLLDIGLPGLNGFEVAKSIRQEPMLKGTLLVAITGYGLESDRLRSSEAGFDHHLVKPTSFSKVEEILAAI